jgi:hypothetical protein
MLSPDALLLKILGSLRRARHPKTKPEMREYWRQLAEVWQQHLMVAENERVRRKRLYKASRGTGEGHRKGPRK